MSENNQKSIRTKNINEAIQSYASENFTPLSECNFKIERVETSIKTSADTEFQIINADIEEIYKDRDKLLNERVQIQQYYNIIIFTQTERDINLNYTIDYGEFTANPKIILHHNSHIPYKSYKPKELFLLLVKELNKIKATHKILINLFDGSMIKNLKAFTKYIYAGKFTKKIRIPLFDGLEPDITSASRLIMWYEEKNVDQKIKEVEANEIIIEYKKPRFGKNGFNAHGEIIDSGSATNADDLQLEVDLTTIKIKEDANKKQYIAKRKGFVNITNNKIVIDNKIKMNKISRVEEALSEDQDNNIEVHVSQNDTTKDSVGAGVELTSETIHINGHVGANSILEAINLRIDGATHQDSTQFAREAVINRHKGNLRCKSAKISLLEGGEVHATTVDVEASLAGVIHAQDVTIGHVKSNLKVYASNSITIRLVSGEDNLFKINYKEVPIINSKIDLINEDIEDLKYSLEEASRHNLSKVTLIKQNIENFKDELRQIKNSVKTAKISIQKPFNGLNTIIFTLPNTEEITFKTDAREYKPFYLEFDDNQVTLHPVNKIFSINS